MFDRALSPPLHAFFWVNISEFPYSSSVAQIWIFDLGEMFHNVIIKNFALLVLLVVLLNSELYYNFFFFFRNIFFLSLLKGSAITWQNNLKISFIKFFIWFIWLSVKFFNNVWYIQNAHELHIKICFINVAYCILYICSGVYRVSIFSRCRLFFHNIVGQ